MLKRGLVAGAALVLVPLAAFAAPLDRQPGKSFPLISGKYLITLSSVCQPSLSITYGTVNGATVVTGVNLETASGTSGMGSGRVDATGNTNGSGTFAYTATQSSGDPIVLNSNNGGPEGKPLQTGVGSGSIPFVQTATTLALTDQNGTGTFNIYYGLSKKGIVETAGFGGPGDQGCMEVGSLSAQK